jgi:hypothetical protein
MMSTDAPPSLASQLPQGFVMTKKIAACGSSYGIRYNRFLRVYAIAGVGDQPATMMSTDAPPSLASQLPQGFVMTKKIAACGSSYGIRYNRFLRVYAIAGDGDQPATMMSADALPLLASQLLQGFVLTTKIAAFGSSYGDRDTRHFCGCTQDL